MPSVNEVLAHGWRIHQGGDVAEAERIYRHVLAKAPHSAAAWCYLGIALHDGRRYAGAEEAYRRALELQPAFPVAWNNLGNTLRYLGRVSEAEAAFDEALAQRPGYVNALKNRGTLRVWTGDLRGAREAYADALRLAPEEPELHRNLGVIDLLEGRFREGWREYRWRWRMPGFRRPAAEEAIWDGSDPSGKTIFLYPEQGLGDTMHFIRMAGELRDRGATTVVRCPQKLVGLLQTCDGIDRLVPEGTGPGPFHAHASLIDVADRLVDAVEAIPRQGAYLHPPENLVAYWRGWLDRLPAGRRVGICWQGNPQHQADRYRSVALDEFAPLAALPGVTLVSLQQGYGAEQLERVAFAARIERLPEGVDRTSGAFLDTAAIMRGLDLVVTTDTSTAHLAGALAVPVWVALGYVPDWRWLLAREDSPWYPRMRLFRQPALGDWAAVFEAIAAKLGEQGEGNREQGDEIA